MTITIATLRTAGLSPEQIVRVMEVEETERLTRQREQWRVNSKNYRDRHPSHNDANDANDQQNLHIDKKILSSSSSSSQSISKKRKKVSLPENWMPNENGMALARKQGWAKEKIKLEIHRFIDHAHQHDRQCADWQAAWRNWVTSPYQHKGNFNGSRAPTVQDAFDLALNRLSGDGVEGNPPMVDVTPRRD